MTPICLSHLMVFSRVTLLRFHRCINLKAVRKFRCVRRLVLEAYCKSQTASEMTFSEKLLRLAVSQIRIFSTSLLHSTLLLLIFFPQDLWTERFHSLCLAAHDSRMFRKKLNESSIPDCFPDTT